VEVVTGGRLNDGNFTGNATRGGAEEGNWGEERGLMGGSQPSAAEARVWERPEAGAKLGWRGENDP
jgi:hypothetical protein